MGGPFDGSSIPFFACTEMRTSELAFTVAVMLGCFFRIQHWIGAGFLILFGGSLLALFYFPFGYRTLPAPKRTDQLLWFSLLGGMALCTVVFGLVAYLLRWPLHDTVLMAGALGCGLVLLIGLVLRFKHPRLDIYLDGMLLRCFVLGALAFTLLNLFDGVPFRG
jgi:hypothetical protein